MSKKVRHTLAEVESAVVHVLGKYRKSTMTITDAKSFYDYISSCIGAGIVAIDTETNNSLDPLTCKLMGLCLYAPGINQAYIPVNHRNPNTKIRLPAQLTERDVKDGLQRILDSGIMIIMHNGKFDYEVLKCTCGISVIPCWDTMIAARLLNENELSGLKTQYISKIDKSQEKYDIESLFEDVQYADVDPKIFALYPRSHERLVHA